MAANNLPVYENAPVVNGGVTPSTLDTSMTAPTHTTVIATGTAAGLRVREVVAVPNATDAASKVVRIFTAKSGVYTLLDELLIPIVTIAQSTVAPRLSKSYENLVLGTGTTLEVTVSTTGGQGTVSVTALCRDLTA